MYFFRLFFFAEKKEGKQSRKTVCVLVVSKIADRRRVVTDRLSYNGNRAEIITMGKRVLVEVLDALLFSFCECT